MKACKWLNEHLKSPDSSLADNEAEGIAIAPYAPDMNAYIERFFGSLRRECLNHVVPLTQNHLEKVLRTYITHYNSERPHQGIGNNVIGAWLAKTNGAIVCDQHLHGLLKSFRRENTQL